jgi:hypothetical protein
MRSPFWFKHCSLARSAIFSSIILFLMLGGVPLQAASPGNTVILVTSDDPGTGGPGCKLRDAISAADTSALVGDCDGRGGPPFDIELVPDQFYVLKYIDNKSTDEGRNGLPLITANITINGHNATIQRHFKFDETEVPFRFFQVEAGGALRLHDLTLQEGTETLGGAIYNKGIFTAWRINFFSNRGHCGGAIYNKEPARLKVTESTFCHNDADG